MKIVKKPDVSGWKFLYHCSKCDSDLEVDSSDLKYNYYAGDQRDPSYESYSASCAVCNDNFPVSTSNIPKLIQIEVKKKHSSATHYQDR